MQTVIGAFDDRSQAEQAVQRLTQMGLDREDIHIEHQPASDTRMAGEADEGVHEDRRGFFARLFGLDEDNPADSPWRHTADTWDEAVHRGSAVVVVDARDDAQAERAAVCLHEAGALDVDERSAQWRQEGRTGGTADTGAQARTGQAELREGRTLDVVEEQLQVGKRTLEQGGVRVFERVTERPVREVVRLREERAVVERRPVDRELRQGELDAFREGSVEVREMAEEPVVAKTARVVEEVRVGKQVREREATVEDKVRRKDVEVERLGERARAVASDRDAAAVRTEREPSKRSTTQRDPGLTKPRKP